MARDFEPYEGHDCESEKDEGNCVVNCCCGCLKKILKHTTKQLWKLFLFVGIYALCIWGIVWGVNEIVSLNNFSEVSNGCKIVSIDTDLSGEVCNECDCEYYYNPFEFDKKRICDECDSVKYTYTVTAEHCGDELLKMEEDYWNDKACGEPLKEVNKTYTCYLYEDCRGKYSFDTMYANQDELIYPIIVIVLGGVVMIITFLLKCLCC